MEVLEQAGRYVANAGEARRAKAVRGTKGLIVVKKSRTGNFRINNWVVKGNLK